MRYLILLIATAFLSSCGILELLAEPADSELAVRSLHLEYDSFIGLLGNRNVSGNIRNIGTQPVTGIELRATILHPDKTYDFQTITIPETLAPDAKCTFAKKIVMESDDKLILEIRKARIGS
jgi:hypothetical protein